MKQLEKVKTLDQVRWSEPDESGFRRIIGMANAREAFDWLKEHLKAMNLLPDGYFIFKEANFVAFPDLPEGCRAICTVDWGQENGICMNITVSGFGVGGRLREMPFATGKTYSVNADAYYRMYRIAAECSLMLNGDGYAYNHENVELVLDLHDAKTLLDNCQADIDELDLTANIRQTLETVCSLLRKQIEGPIYQPSQSLEVLK